MFLYALTMNTMGQVFVPEDDGDSDKKCYWLSLLHQNIFFVSLLKCMCLGMMFCINLELNSHLYHLPFE